MTVQCPHCAAIQPLAELDLGPEGRMVRCERCGTRWLARTFDGRPYRQPELLQAGGPPEISDAVVIEHIAPGTRQRALPPPPLSKLPPAWRRTEAVDRRVKALGIVFGVLVAFVVLRAPIVAALPELSAINRLPAEVDLLEFQKVRSETVHLGGISTLFIEGEIVNRAAAYVQLPAIRITLKSTAGEAVTSWLVEPSASGLAGGGAIGFRSALAAPPADATQVTLNLALREGETVGLR